MMQSVCEGTLASNAESMVWRKGEGEGEREGEGRKRSRREKRRKGKKEMYE